MDKNKLILVAVIIGILAISLIIFALNTDDQKDKEQPAQPQTRAEAYRSVFGGK